MLTAHICDEICPEPVVEGGTAGASQEGIFTGHLTTAGQELEVKA